MALYTSVMLPSGSLPSGMAFDGTYLYATDGINPTVFVFTSDGLFVSSYNTVRPYSKVTYDEYKSRFVSVDGKMSGILYILNKRFEEVGRIVLEMQNYSGRYVADAGFSENSDFQVTHPKSLCIYSPDGSFSSTVTNNPFGREFLSWSRYKSADALCFTEKNRIFVTVNRIGGNLPTGVRLLSFIPHNNGIYGFFSVGGLYSYILPVYENGSLNHEIYGNFAFIAGKIASDTCKNR